MKKTSEVREGSRRGALREGASGIRQGVFREGACGKSVRICDLFVSDKEIFLNSYNKWKREV